MRKELENLSHNKNLVLLRTFDRGYRHTEPESNLVFCCNEMKWISLFQ